MPKLPKLAGKTVINILKKIGFEVVRQKGSHVQMKHDDGRLVTIPVHAGKTIGSLLRKILRDAELTREEFIALLE
ncbi:type II toxin-antitoxin system HicA family toxin [Komarekiella sp. 'clone 1']|uniref:Type II toxin-antitoxin system HicA family toxin n=1 Tax=Komarekiella delphini-convector SJRDD-AB1 TaxID=2593771 RepID=A0AA40SVD0_9NOST|nr:type II toxin-antitoxin system HicA family toxin [Komarekiella delphini-convector]MBD6615971.1 type II toxin-antitoxin system HicA family toxin [Komarekiella delphini-convector SJRDD-AB1]